MAPESMPATVPVVTGSPTFSPLYRQIKQLILQALDEIYLPGETFAGLTLEVLNDWQDSLYSLFESRFGVRMIRAEERIRAVAADRAGAELLRVKEGSPLLSVERVSYTYGDRPMEWRRGLYSTADHCYFNELG